VRRRVLGGRKFSQLLRHSGWRDGGRTGDDFAAASGVEWSIAFRFLRACTKIGSTDCDDAGIGIL